MPTIRAIVEIKPGSRLYYDCPLGGADYRSEQFFNAHRGKYATFIGYSEKLVDVLDSQGLIPGRYLDPKGIRVQFDGEEVEECNPLHFILKRADNGKLVDASDKERWLGDLLHPILFYPGDIVRFKKKPDVEGVTDEPRKVHQVFLGKPFTNTDVPRYEVMETEAETSERIRKFDEENEKRSDEKRLWRSPIDRVHGWNTAGEDIELVARGNVWALYNDPTKLSFESDEAEAVFWEQDGICRYVQDDIKQSVLDISPRELARTFGLSLADAYRLFTTEYADVISPTLGNLGGGTRYNIKIVHECFADHRDRIRALNEKLWGPSARAVVSPQT